MVPRLPRRLVEGAPPAGHGRPMNPFVQKDRQDAAPCAIVNRKRCE